MRLVHTQVAAHAARRPESPAVIVSAAPEAGGAAAESLTYGDLDRRANQLAHVLRAAGVGPEVTVALLAPRGAAAVIAALAIAKAGGCYLPLDPAYPEARLRFALTDSAARVLLSTERVIAAVPALAELCPRTLLLDRDAALFAAASTEEPAANVGEDDLAYVIYTSGSTGQPKAVEVPHRGLANLVAWHAETYGLKPGDRATRLAGSGFDAAVWETWSALTAGAALYVPAGDLLLDPPRLVAWLAAQRITHTFLATPLAEAVLAETWPAETALKVLLTGGDRLHRAPRPGLPFVLANHYGPTEASVVTTQGAVPVRAESAPASATPLSASDKPPSIGRAIAGLTLQIVVEAAGDLRPAQAGEAGELWVGGIGLARGYRGRPELTALRFVPHPWGGPGERLYRTGDLVRRLPAGDLEFIGRIDFQVKVRGFRIELGEIEAVLCAQPEVGAGAVLAPEAADGNRRLVGYVARRPGAELTAGDLRAALGRALPEHMVPAAWVFLPGLPLNPNGKVDRAALALLAPGDVAGEEPALAGAAPAEPAACDTALGPLPARLAAIFGEVLGISGVRGGDDFFALGGHSLRATQVLSRLRASCGVELAVADLYAHPTVAGLAQRVAERLATAGGGVTAERIPRRVPGGQAERLPLSYGQEDLWFVEHLAPGSAVYNTPMGVDLRGPLDREALRRALDGLVARHEALRTVFPAEQGRPSQQVLPASPFALPLVDLTGVADVADVAGVAGVADDLERQVGRQPMDLDREPAFRALLVRLGRDEHRLLLLFHHIVADDWTLAIVLAELAVLYRAAAGGIGGETAALAEPALQFADFALWQRATLDGPRRDELVAWWRECLARSGDAVRPLALPTDRPRPAEASFAGARLTASLPPALVGELGDLARRLDASLFMVLLAAWQTLLGRYAAQDAFVVGAPNAGRNRVELEGVVGLLVNTLALPAELAGAPSGTELIGRVRATTLGAYAHQDLPYQLLVDALRPAHDPSSPGLFQALFVLGNAPQPPRQLAPGLGLALREIEVAAAKVDLTLSLAQGEAGISCHWDYATRLFDPATLRRMAGHFATLLAGLVAAPERRMAEQPLLTAAEEKELLAWHWETARRPLSSRPEDRLDDLFAAQAARTPWATALVVGEERLSYAGLAYRVDRLARRLVERGVGPEVPVALFLPRSADLVVAMLATHAAGGFYVPLDPTYPDDRLAFLLADSRAWVLVTDTRLAQAPFAAAAAAGREVVVVDAPGVGAEETDLPLAALVPGKDPAQLAYLIYTSGSTGRPKGVAVSHANAALFVRWAAEQFSCAELRGVLAGTSIAFDLSVFEVFVPLATGGTVILAENALALAGLPARGEVTLVNTVPSALAELLRQGALPATVQTVNLAGEALPRALADQAYAQLGAAPGFKLYNLYGPSEDTTYSTFALVERAAERAPKIGAPLAGSSAHVVDAAGSPLPVGVPGELLLGGAGLARGYFGRPDWTAERFLPDPFAVIPGARLYKTGDLVRRDPSGGLDFLGRLDHQVKVRGYRIELQEIEAALAACPGVSAAAVTVAAGGPAGDKRLVAYFVASGTAGAVPALRRHLGERLPAYMIPAVWVPLAALPLTANGKLDRRALPAPPAEQESAAEYVAPRGSAERIIAEVWAAVLRVARVGVCDNFFDLGGDSILTIQVVARCRERGLVLAARQIFRHPTVAELALLAVPAAPSVAPPAEEPVAPCSTGEFLAFTEAGLSKEELADLLAELG